MPLSEIFAAFRWWLAIMIIGLAATPLAFVLFQKLPDRGYAFVKMLGLLLAGYIFWILGSLGFLGNNSGGILFSLASLLVLSWFIYRQHKLTGAGDPENHLSLRHWTVENRKQILLTELIFALLFAVWVWVRAQNPAIAATEKPMEFAFLNSVGRGAPFPPLDPWLSGFAISYYYFGYVMTSFLARLALVAEPIAFNLSIAWLVAAAGTGAFGLVFNLLSIQKLRRGAVILATLAAIALPLAGNLVIGLEIAHANNLGSPSFWQWLDIRELNEPPSAEGTPRYESSSWWWWRSSRPIREVHLSGRAEDGLEPIAEFPAFSFILGDLHPHVLALPFAFLALALALAWWLKQSPKDSESALDEQWDHAGWIDRIQSLIRFITPQVWLLSALILGGLSFLNTWDVLIYLFILIAVFFLARWRDVGWNSRIFSQTIAIFLLLLLPIILFYLPFYLGFRSQAGAPYLLPQFMQPTRLVQFLTIFGMPLWVITILLVAQAGKQRFQYWKSGLMTAVTLILVLLLLTFFFGLIIASSPDGAGRVSTIANELDITLSERPPGSMALGWGLTAILALAPALLQAKISSPAMTLLLAAFAGLVVMIWRYQFDVREEGSKGNEPGALPFALLMIAVGALLTVGPEFIYLRDNFGFRLNTIFKFYYQAWVMFGLAALFGIGYLWQNWRGAQRFVPILAAGGYILAFMVALLFPINAVQSRALEFRGPLTAEDRQQPTLNGLAQVSRFNPDEYAAIMWLRENVNGSPVITEAIGGQYSGYGRVSANTGLPTLLGWAGHEYQWRGDTPEPAAREPVIRAIYSQPDIDSVRNFLDEYNVQYIYVGGLEREAYGSDGLDKFADQLEVAFSNNSVTIYRWQPQT